MSRTVALRPRGQHVVVGLRLLQHQPHRLARSRRRSPSRAWRRCCRAATRCCLPSLMRATASVTLRVTNSTPAQGRFVVEQDAARGVHAEALAVVDRQPVARRAWPRRTGCAGRRRRLVLDGLLHLAEHLARRGLVEAAPRFARRMASSTLARRAGDLRGEQRLLPRRRHEALGAEVVHFRRLALLQGAHHRREVGEVALDQPHGRFEAEVPQPPERVGRPPREQAVDFVALLEQQLSQIAAVLAGDAGDECARPHGLRSSDGRSECSGPSVIDSRAGRRRAAAVRARHSPRRSAR